MSRSQITTRDQERPFGIDELFFSTTDVKGVILSGNEVFARVAAYGEVQELIGKPHNIIRHPDMPRAVFHLLWDYLNRGKSFAGYVKNMARDGCYYWVMALVVPIEGGFLSVRFKPSGPHFPIVKELYKEMLAVEKEAGDENWRAGMAQAAETLMARLKEKGVRDYDEFMRAALAAEMISRRQILAAEAAHNRGHANRIDAQDGTLTGPQAEVAATLKTCLTIERLLEGLFSEAAAFLDLLQKLDSKSASLLALADNVHLVSINGVISSSRLGTAGGGLSVVTQELTKIAEESTAVITEMTDNLALTAPLRETAFAITAAKLQVEMAIFFARELLRANDDSQSDEAHTRIRADLETLVRSFSTSTELMLATLPKSEQSVSRRIHLNEQLAGVLRKLSRVQVTGKVQSAQVAGASHFQEYFEQISEQLRTSRIEFQELVEGIPFLMQHLPRFEHAGRSVQFELSLR